MTKESLDVQTKLNKPKNLFYKAAFSATAGLPCAYLLNVAILPYFIDLLIENAWLAGAVIAAPFVAASITRMFFIDWLFYKYHINIEPVHLFRKLFEKLR